MVTAQPHAKGFIGLTKMADISSGIVATCITVALIVKRREITGILGIFNHKRPCDVMTVPFRAIRVGKTQSNISIPRITPSIKESVAPTPIRYHGLFSGKSGAVVSKMRFISCLDSPTERPPIEYPGKSRLTKSCADCFLKSSKPAPWTMPNKPCQSGF